MKLPLAIPAFRHRLFPGVLGCSLSLSLWSGGTELLLGTGAGPFRHWSSQTFVSAELDHTFDKVPIGAWVAADMSIANQFLGLGPLFRLPLGQNWEIAASSGPGIWIKGRTKIDLGTHFQFRSAFYISRRLDKRNRIGLSINHYSNGGIKEPNPGAETLRVFWGFKPEW